MATKKRRTIVSLSVVMVLAAAGATAALVARDPQVTETAGEEQILTVEAKAGTVSVRVEGPSVVEAYRS